MPAPVTQLCLAGMDRPARDHLFFALLPDPQAAEAASAVASRIRQENGLSCKPVDPARLHVTLQVLGAYDGVPRGIVAKARDAAARITSTQFAVDFTRACSFGGEAGHSPLVLRAGSSLPTLVKFHTALLGGMAQAGMKARRARFTPHMTLFYGAPVMASETVAAVKWTATDFVLIHSIFGEGRHVRLGRWPLRRVEAAEGMAAAAATSVSPSQNYGSEQSPA